MTTKQTTSENKYYISQINKDKTNGYIAFTNLNPTDTSSTTILQEENRKYFKQNADGTAQLHINKLPDGKTMTLGFVFYNKDNVSNVELLKINDNTNILKYNEQDTFEIGYLSKETVFINDNIKLNNPNQYCIILELKKIDNNAIIKININNELDENENVKYHEISIPSKIDKLNIVLGNNYYLGSINLNVASESYYDVIKTKYADMYPELTTNVLQPNIKPIIKTDIQPIIKTDIQPDIQPINNNSNSEVSSAVIHGILEYTFKASYTLDKTSDGKLKKDLMLYNDTTNNVYFIFYIENINGINYYKFHYNIMDNESLNNSLINADNKPINFYNDDAIEFKFIDNYLEIIIPNTTAFKIDIIPLSDYNEDHPYYNYIFSNDLNTMTIESPTTTTTTEPVNFSGSRDNPISETFKNSYSNLGILDFYKNLI
jgi:hypothetical protein